MAKTHFTEVKTHFTKAKTHFTLGAKLISRNKNTYFFLGFACFESKSDMARAKKSFKVPYN